jgi:GH25 family lysozyme M1 (1,4-beta-N-acetylmuramidase)
VTKPVLLMIDVSSNNDLPDLARHHAAGYRVIALKATEGVSYAWADAGPLADIWHKLGGRVVFYHFATSGHPGREQADHFLAAVRPHLHDVDILALDIEGQPASYRQWTAGEVPIVARTFMARVEAKAPSKVHRWVYGTFYFLRDQRVLPLKGWRLWIAGYQSTEPAIPPGWKRWTAWQYTDRAKVPGVAGTVDQSHLRGSVLPGWRLLPTPLRQTKTADRLTLALNRRKLPLDAAGDRVLDRLIAAARRAKGVKP